jgi:hypothetical protein
MRRSCIAVGALTLALGLGTPAFAQDQTTPAPSTGKLVVEQIQSGWLFAPDVRAADLNGRTGALAGGYIGRITDRQWIIGAGGYFLTNRDDHFKMAYGGPVFEWLIRSDRKIGFGVRTLLGAGTATLPFKLADLVDPRILQAGPRITRNTRTNPTLGLVPDITVGASDDFFIAEPQANVTVNLSQGQRIVFGLGYRAVAQAPVIGDELKGLSGSVSFQIGGK